MNPTAPTIKGLIKMHKPECPIQPKVNQRGAPAYSLARLFTQKIKQLAPLPNRHNIDNTKDVIKKLNDTPLLPHFNLASMDISNLYTNIPVAETSNIISNTKEKSTRPQTQQELLNWYDVFTQQNYFTNNDEILIQRNRHAMGTPTCGRLSGFFLQKLKHLHLTHLSSKHKIINYIRYIDDILLIFNSKHKHPKHMGQIQCNTRKSKIMAEIETNNKINYLDVTIHKTPTNWKISMYSKPTFTDTIIPCNSNHPAQQKYTAVRFLYNRLNTYKLHKDECKTEENIIQNTMYNNAFPTQPHKPTTSKPSTSMLDTQIATQHKLHHINGSHLLTLEKKQISLQTCSERPT